MPALLPETYCGDVHERLVLYKRLANCETEAELTAMSGRADRPFRAAAASRRRRFWPAIGCVSPANGLGVVRIDSGPERTQVQFGPRPDFDPARLIALIRDDGRYRFAGQDRVRIERAAPSVDERVALVREFLGRLA